MKKTIIAFIMVFIVSCLFLFTGCANQEDMLNVQIAELEARHSSLAQQISLLEKEKIALEEEILSEKISRGSAKYIVTFNISQSHLFFDITNVIKDSMNDITIQIPVDEEYYHSVNVGDVINDDFRMGSFILTGSIGSWKITIKDKEIR